MGDVGAAAGEIRLLDAMRRLSRAVAAGVRSSDLAELAAGEVVEALGAGAGAVLRYDGDEMVLMGGQATAGHGMFTRGTRFPLDGSPVALEVKRTRGPVHMPHLPEGTQASFRRTASLGYVTALGAPLFLGPRLWGVLYALGSEEHALAPGSEIRLGLVADLLAAAVASAEQLDLLEAQTAEQAALLNVSRRVVESPTAEHVFPIMAAEAASLLGLSDAAVIRFAGRGGEVLAEWHEAADSPRVTVPDPVAELVRWRRDVVSVGDPDVTAPAAAVLALGRPMGWGAPLELDGEVWGALVAAGEQELPVAHDAATRLDRFARLSSLAVARVEARAAIIRQVVETQQFASLVEHSGDYIGIADLEGGIFYLNPAGLRTIGLPADADLSGLRIDEVIAPEAHAVWHETGLPAILECGSWQGDLVFRNFDSGESVPMSSNVFSVTHPESGEPLYIATVSRDLREQKAVEQRLRQQAEEVERLAAARRFLLVETLGAEERMRRQIGDALHDEALQQLYAASQDLQEIDGEHEALDRARAAVRAAGQQLRETVLDLHPAASWTRDPEARLHSLLEEAAKRAGFEFRFEYSAPRTDADQLLLVLARELIHNAVKHAEARTVEVSVSHEDGSLRLGVSDDGKGIPPERPAEALAQGHIGLASARERVGALGGSFELTSEPGAGTRVAVVLPAT